MQAAERTLKIGKGQILPETRAYGLYFQGIAHYHRNELPIAEEKLVAAVKDSYAHNGVNFAHSAFALALTYQARRRTNQAGAIGQSVTAFTFDTNNSGLLNIAKAFQAELAFRQGRLAEAFHWSEHFAAKPFLTTYRFYLPQLTLAKILLAQDTETGRQQAAGLPSTPLPISRSFHLLSPDHARTGNSGTAGKAAEQQGDRSQTLHFTGNRQKTSEQHLRKTHCQRSPAVG